MIRINLLPFRAKRKKENIRRQVFIFVSFTVLVILLMFYYNNVLTNQIEDLNDKVNQTRNELARTRKNAKEVDRIKEQIATLEKKMAVIETLEKNRKEPVEFLRTLSSTIVEKRMWLTSMTSTAKSVSLAGIALDNKTVADFMTNLESTELFSSVNLSDLNRTEVKEVSLRTFSISCERKAEDDSTGKK